MTSLFLQYDKLALNEKQRYYEFSNKESVHPSNIINSKESTETFFNRHQVKNTGRIGFGILSELSEIYTDNKSLKRDRNELNFNSLSLQDNQAITEPLTKKSTQINNKIQKKTIINKQNEYNNNKNPYLTSLPVGTISGKDAAMARMKAAGLEWEEEAGVNDLSVVLNASSDNLDSNGELSKNMQKKTQESITRQNKVINRKYN